MTSLKSLVDSECGTQNSLIKLTSHLTSNTNNADLLLTNRRATSTVAAAAAASLSTSLAELQSDQVFVNEYLLNETNSLLRRVAPSTFHMGSILNELRHIETPKDWANEYTKTMPTLINTNLSNQQAHLQWSTDYLTQRESTLYDDTWDKLLIKQSSNTLQLTNTQVNDEEMKKTANELLDSMQDSRFSETEFLQFVKDIAQPSTNDDEIERIWSDSAKEQQTKINNEHQSWLNDYEHTNEANIDFWDNLNEKWNSLAQSDASGGGGGVGSSHPWLDEFQKVFDTYKTYEFDQENPLVAHTNPFDEGLNRLKSHDIVNAVLLFEAAVQKEPNNALAWQYLGTTQVENEQDAQAIRALKQCLELKQQDNLIVLSTLATSYTNESMQRLAFDCLFKWLECNPKYTHLVKSKTFLNSNRTKLSTLSIVHYKDFMDLQEVYLEAIRESSDKIDPDLQCCLGVLFHLSGEYDKAADCFKTALQIRPNDHLLWNKLGATYANSNRNEEAIEAYFQALKLCPGFVRARYNLGIGCMNLGAYREAVEHFLTALSQQAQASILDTRTNLHTQKLNQMSDTIWSTMRLALSYLNRNDLYQTCASKDLDFLKKEFKID